MGTPNKTTAALKDAILTAAEEALPGGKVGYLKWLAKNVRSDDIVSICYGAIRREAAF
jgi:hypothetical protein